MEHLAASPLSGWSNFYVIVGSGAAALIGLQFVVIVLVRDIRGVTSSRTIDAFGTPTIVHFGAALLISCIVIAPWPSLTGAAITLRACGVVLAGYAIVVFRRARTQTDYKPVLEDWLWHNIIPTMAYVTLIVASIGLRSYPTVSTFAIAAVALLLLFTGIHNAWDTVTYMLVERIERERIEREESEREQSREQVEP
jgi:hypothetical protein